MRYNALNTDPTSKGQKGYTHAMNRIPPSQKIRKKTEELFNQGLEGEGDITSLIFHLGVERLAQELLEQEATDYLEREHYQRRRPEQEHRGYRNGYGPRRIRTAEGEIQVQVPQVRDASQTYRSRLMTFLRGNSEVFERLAVEIVRPRPVHQGHRSSPGRSDRRPPAEPHGGESGHQGLVG